MNSNPFLKTSLLLAMTVGLSGQALSQETVDRHAETKKQIRKLLQTQVDCWNQEDLKGFMSTYWKSKKLTFSSGGQTTHGWQATFDRYKKKYQGEGAEMGELRFEKLQIEMLNDDSCYVLGEWYLTMKKDKPHGNFSLVMKKMEDGWKIVHDHSSSKD